MEDNTNNSIKYTKTCINQMKRDIIKLLEIEIQEQEYWHKIAIKLAEYLTEYYKTANKNFAYWIEKATKEME